MAPQAQLPVFIPSFLSPPARLYLSDAADRTGAILCLDLGIALHPRIRQDGGRVLVPHSLVNVISAFGGPSPGRAHLVKVSSDVVGRHFTAGQLSECEQMWSY